MSKRMVILAKMEKISEKLMNAKSLDEYTKLQEELKKHSENFVDDIKDKLYGDKKE